MNPSIKNQKNGVKRTITKEKKSSQKKQLKNKKKPEGLKMEK